MSLKNILLDISSVLGLDISDPDEKAYHIAKINEAAKELYNSNDLPGCLREQIFQIDDTDNYQAAFPFYVDKIRAIRFYNTNGGKITLEDMRPRYHMHRWGSNGRIRFRIKKNNALLSRGISNAGKLTFTLSEEDNINVTINIIGKTDHAEKTQETVTIIAGQLAVTTANSYEDFDNGTIEKTTLNNKNITITDIDGVEMGIIPNSELRPIYTIVQIREDDFAPVVNNNFPLNTIEVLYKTRFTPFQNDYDEFPCPDCDKLIAWKFIEHYAMLKPGMDQLVSGAALKADQIINELNHNDDLGKELKVEFGPNPMFEAQNAICDNYFTAPVPLIEYIP